MSKSAEILSGKSFEIEESIVKTSTKTIAVYFLPPKLSKLILLSKRKRAKRTNSFDYIWFMLNIFVRKIGIQKLSDCSHYYKIDNDNIQSCTHEVPVTISIQDVP